MVDKREYWRLSHEARQEINAALRQQSHEQFFSQQFAEARRRLASVKVKCLSDIHYQFQFSDGALLNFYPGNQRLYWDRNKPLGPYLELPEGVEYWSLMTVMQAIERAK